MKDDDYYRVYFVAFYFFAVILLLNIIVAFILDVFITQYSKNFSENSLLYRYKKYVMMSILVHQLQDSDQDFDLLHWQITRRVRPALLMQSLFEDNAAAHTQSGGPREHNHHQHRPSTPYQQQRTGLGQRELPSMHHAVSQQTSRSPSDSSSTMDHRSKFLLSNTSKSSSRPRMSSPLRSNRSRRSTVSLRARPSMSMLSMIAMQNSSVPTPSGSTMSREEVAARDIVNYDDLQQMPWGQESLFQDFLHLYHDDQYYKKKHQLRNRNFAAEISTSNLFRKQTSRSALYFDRGLDGLQINGYLEGEHEAKIEEDAELEPENMLNPNMMSDHADHRLN